jgi:hypothetical protein
LRSRTSRIPPYYDLGRASSRDKAAITEAFLRESGYEVRRRGRSIQVESARVHEAAALLRQANYTLAWAPAPERQGTKIEWPLIGSLIVATALLIAAALFLLDNFYVAVILGLSVPSLGLLAAAGLRGNDATGRGYSGRRDYHA